jgi:hypothetical protein
MQHEIRWARRAGIEPSPTPLRRLIVKRLRPPYQNSVSSPPSLQGLCPLLDGAVHDTVLPVNGCGTADAESTQ